MNTPQKRNVQNIISAILEHKTLSAIFQNVVVGQKKKEVWKILSIIFTTFLAVGGFYLGWMTSIHSQQAESTRNYNQRQTQYIESVIQNKIAWVKKIDDAIMDLRKTRYLIVLRCKYHQPMNLQEQETLRFNARYNLVKSFVGAGYIFNNESVPQKIRELVEFDGSVENVCAPNAPSDDMWRKYLHEVNDLMGLSIKADEGEIRSLKE